MTEKVDRWTTRATHIFVLTSFAIAQPLFDLLGKSAAFFVAHRASPMQMWIFAVGVLLIPPLLIAAVVTAIGAIRARLGAWVQALAVGSLMSLAVVPPLVRGLNLRSLLIPLVIVVVVGGAIAYSRWSGIRTYLSWGLVAPPAFLVMFAVFSPVNDLFFPPAVAAPLDVTIEEETPIVLLLFDETALGLILKPNGDIDDKRFPNFARLAGQSTWYPNATTVADGTEWALPAFHTGSMPDVEKLPTHTDYPNNLFSLLQSSYDIEATEFITRLCPPTVCKEELGQADESALFKDALIVYLHSVLPSGLRSRWLPPLDDRWAGFGADNEDQLAEVAAENLRRGLPMDRQTFQALTGRDSDADPLTSFERMLGRLPNQAGESQWLWYLHLCAPHVPSIYLPEGISYFGGSDIPGLRLESAPLEWGDDTELVKQALQRQLLQTQFADHLLGRMLDRLEASPQFSDAMVVVFSDHGVAFEPGRFRRALIPETADQILPIPLFVKYPGQVQGTVDERPAELIDVVPTIADVLEVELPWEADGTSLLGSADTSQRRAMSHSDESAHDVPAGLDRTALSRIIHQEFGAWGGRYDLYAPARHLQLLGRSPRELPRGDEFPGLGFAVDNLSLFEGLDLDSGFLPAFVTGSLRGPGAQGHIELLLMVNGRAAGTGLSYAEGSDIRFSGMVAPDFFQDGRNQVDIYAIGENGRFSPLQRVGSGYEVTTTPEGELVSVTTPGGEKLMPMTEGIEGRIHAEEWRSYLRVSGWGADIEGGAPPESFLVLHNGQVIRVASTIESPDLVELYGETFSDSRFYEELPLEEVSSVDELVFVALFDGRAAIIPRG